MNGQPSALQVRDSASVLAAPHRPERGVAELHHQVIQAIFAVGLDLQSIAAITADPLVRDRMDKAASDLDGVISLLRDAVLGLSCRH